MSKFAQIIRDAILDDWVEIDAKAKPEAKKMPKAKPKIKKMPQAKPKAEKMPKTMPRKKPAKAEQVEEVPSRGIFQ